jgi:hypothetical protein
VLHQVGPPKYGIWMVRLDNGDKELVGRDAIEALTRRTFFFHPESGQSAWTVEQAQHAPLDAGNRFPYLSGNEWLRMDKQGKNNSILFYEFYE